MDAVGDLQSESRADIRIGGCLGKRLGGINSRIFATVAYGVMEVDGQDVRPEPLEERRKRLAKLLSRNTKAMRDGIQIGEAITGDGGRIFRHACAMDPEGIVSKRIGSRYVSGRTRAWLKTKNPDFKRS
jgi:ATP-dependent DNA ligase